MTETLRAAIDSAIDHLRAVSDPSERYRAAREVRLLLKEGDLATQGVEQEIALELRAEDSENQRTWLEVGRLMGGITRQRAEQISRGV